MTRWTPSSAPSRSAGVPAGRLDWSATTSCGMATPVQEPEPPAASASSESAKMRDTEAITESLESTASAKQWHTVVRSAGSFDCGPVSYASWGFRALARNGQTARITMESERTRTPKAVMRDGHQRRAVHWLGRVSRRGPNLLEMWRIGIRPTTGK